MTGNEAPQGGTPAPRAAANPIHNLLLSRLSTFPTHRAYAKYLECDEAELSRIVNGKQLISHRILVDLLTHQIEKEATK
jgi:plasmid maintenance system antidote protein VapI